MQIVTSAIKSAAKLRGKYPAGAIVMHGAAFSGWMNCLRDPGHWVPGCVAVLPDGSAYVARGGNDYDGAQQWVPAN